MDIKKCLDKYSDDFFSSMYGMHKIANPNTSMEQAKAFLHQYAMSDSEYNNICIPAMRKIFVSKPETYFDIRNMGVGELFGVESDYFTYLSSPLFWKETYELIQAVCKDYGDQYIFIVEEERCEECPEAAFKLKIPISNSWEVVSEGGFIADVLFNMFNNNYYVFGDSGNWGKWCDYDNDYIDYEVFGYKDSNAAILAYKDYFSISKNDFKECVNLPKNLRVAFWNTIKREKKSKMKYFSFKTKQGETADANKLYGKRLLQRFFDRALIFFLNKVCCIPRANPDFDDMYYRVKTWYVEYDEENNYTNREVGLDSNGEVIFKAPYKKDLGFWVEKDLTLKDYSDSFEIHYVNKSEFDMLWTKTL